MLYKIKNLFSSNAKNMPTIVDVSGEWSYKSLDDVKDTLKLYSFVQYANEVRNSVAKNMPAQKWLLTDMDAERELELLQRKYRSVSILTTNVKRKHIATYNEVCDALVKIEKSHSYAIDSYFCFFQKICEMTYQKILAHALENETSSVMLDTYAKLYDDALNHPSIFCQRLLNNDIEALSLFYAAKENLTKIAQLAQLIALRVLRTQNKYAFVLKSQTEIVSDFRGLKI